MQLGDHRLIKVLIAFGANTNALNSANQTPLDLLKGPQRAISQNLRDLHWLVHAEQKKATPEQIPLPSELPPPAKQLCSDGTSSVDRHLPKAQNSDTTTLKIPHLQKQRTVSMTSPPNVAELFPPCSSSQVTSKPCISITLEKGAGIEYLSNRKVNKLTGVLQDAGAERRVKLIRNTFSLSRNSRITFDELSENLSEIEVKSASGSVEKSSGNSHELMNTRLHYYSLLQKLIKKHLNDIDDRLPHTPNEASSLVLHMREVRMLQIAGSRILFLDGGGLRGLIQVEILSQVYCVY